MKIENAWICSLIAKILNGKTLVHWMNLRDMQRHVLSITKYFSLEVFMKMEP